MANEMRQYPPSDLKLSRLRRIGIVPFSGQTLIIGLAAGSLVGTLLLSTLWVNPFGTLSAQVYNSSFTELQSGMNVIALLKDTGALVARGVLLFLAPVVTSVVLVGLLQTRFLFSFGTFRFSLTSARNRGGFLGGLFAGCSCFAILLVALRALCLEYYPRFFAQTDYFLAGPVERQINVWFTPILRYHLLGIFVIVVLIGAIARFVVVLRFREEQGMTREEMLQELRESEASPEMRQALRSQHLNKNLDEP